MNIDERLLKFKSEVGENIGIIDRNKTELSNNINTLVSINNNIASQLNNALKSDGGEMVSSMIELINQTATELNQSIESNLGKTITECKKLNDGITTLENILTNYNSKISQLNNMEEDNPKRGTVQSEINNLKEEFAKKNQELCILHDSILGITSTISTVEELNISDSSIDFSFNAGFSGADLSNSIFYEKDGVIYQKVIPYQTTGGLSATYIIEYDKNAILNAVGTDSKMGQQAIAFLNSKVANGDKASTLWKMFGRNYEKEEYDDIAKMFAALQIELGKENFDDVLGNLYEELGLSSKHLGQFFTPIHISDLMAKMTFNADDTKKEIDKNGYTSMSDPCCGSGRMLLSYLKVCRENDIDMDKVYLDGADLSKLCSCMTYVNLSLLGASAIVYNQDTLLLDVYDSFITPALTFNKNLTDKLIEKGVLIRKDATKDTAGELVNEQ